MRAKPVKHDDGSPYGIRWDCPGCGNPHVVPTTGPTAWGFNGDFDRPTLTPSILIYGHLATERCAAVPRCHSFVRDGRIEFLGDCTHTLAGTTVDMPDLT